LDLQENLQKSLKYKSVLLKQEQVIAELEKKIVGMETSRPIMEPEPIVEQVQHKSSPDLVEETKENVTIKEPAMELSRVWTILSKENAQLKERINQMESKGPNSVLI
jgi:hypothetical protein